MACIFELKRFQLQGCILPLWKAFPSSLSTLQIKSMALLLRYICHPLNKYPYYSAYLRRGPRFISLSVHSPSKSPSSTMPDASLSHVLNCLLQFCTYLLCMYLLSIVAKASIWRFFWYNKQYLLVSIKFCMYWFFSYCECIVWSYWQLDFPGTTSSFQQYDNGYLAPYDSKFATM